MTEWINVVMFMGDIYYIVELKQPIKLTTINKRFCGKFIRQSHGNLYFELNGSGALVVVPEEWIMSCAPAKILCEYDFWKE